METNTAKQLKELEQAVGTLNGLIGLVRRAALTETTQFLEMAKLHLLMDLNDVSDEDLRALCDRLEGRIGKPGGIAPSRGIAARNRREAEMGLTGRAWHCPSEGSPRGGRRARG